MPYATRQFMGPLFVMLIGAFAQLLLGCDSSREEALRSALEANPTDADTRVELAQEIWDRGDRYEAVITLDAGLLLDPDNESLLRSLGNSYADWGWQESDKKKYKMAFKYFETLIEAGGADADVYRTYGWTLREANRRKDAVEAYDVALALDPDNAAAKNGMAITYRELGRYEDAIPHLLQATEQAPNDYNYWLTLGDAQRLMGDYEAAVASMERAVELAPPDEQASTAEYLEYTVRLALDEPGLGAFYAHFNLGNRHQDEHRPGRAAAEFARAVEVSPPNNHEQLGWCYMNMGQFQAYIQDYEQALEYALLSVKHYKLADNPSRLAFAYQSLAGDYQNLARQHESRKQEYLEKTLHAREKQEEYALTANHQHMAEHALADKASVLHKLYGLEDSRVIAARKAMAKYIPEGGTTDNCAFASVAGTEAYFRMLEKDYEESRRLYKITERLYRTTKHSLLIKSSVSLFNNLSYMARKEGDYDEAIRYGEIATIKFDQARAMLGLDGYRRTVGGSSWRYTYADALIYPAVLKAEASDSDYTQAFEFSERYKGRALLDLLAGKPVENSEAEVREKRRDRRVAQVQVRQVEQQILEEEGNGDTEQLRSLERTLSIERTNYKRLTEDVSVAERQVQSFTEVDANTAEELQAMAEDFTLVSYVLGEDDGLTILVLKKDGIHAWADHEIEESAIRPRIIAFRESLGIDAGATRDLSLELDTDAQSPPPSDVSFEDHAEYLYDLLIAPVLPYLDTKLLYISADSYLNYLPFEALKKDGRFLVEDFAVAYTPSASVLKFCLDKNRYERESVLALGNPNLKNPAFRLVHAENEVNGIEGLFSKVDVYAGDAATEAVVKLQGVDYDVLHFACHGELNLDDPMLTSLRLAPDAENDGYLHAGEVFDCDLSASLVVLSACNSALGELTSGNELMGLTRSFLYAGVPSIVASLWMVDDRSTSFLMRQFYTNLTTMTKAEALQQAKLATMKEYPDPFHWAPFCLQGDYR